MTAPFRLEVFGEGEKAVSLAGSSQAVKPKPVASMGTHALRSRELGVRVSQRLCSLVGQ